MREEIDESTRTNAFGNDDEEYGFHPLFGTYKKMPLKKNQVEDLDRKIKSGISFTETEWFYDQYGKLKQRHSNLNFPN